MDSTTDFSAPSAVASPDTATESTPSETTTATTTETSPELTPDNSFTDAPSAEPETTTPAFDASALPPEFLPTWEQTQAQLAQFKEVEPHVNWLNEVGGRDAVENDLRVFGAAFSQDPTERETGFHQAIYDYSPAAYTQLADDFAQSPYVAEKVLTRYGLGVDEQGNVTINGQPLGAQTQPQSQVSEQAQQVMQSLTPEMAEVFKSLDPEVQEDLALQSEKVRNFNLSNYATTYQIKQQQEAQQRERMQQAQQAQRAQQMQREQQLYTDVRSTIENSLKAAFPDEADRALILNNVETEFFNSVEGDTGWAELKGLLERGEMRKAKQTLPHFIAKAQALATKHSQTYSTKLEGARQMQSLLQQYGTDGVEDIKQLLDVLAKGDLQGAQTHFQRLAMAAQARSRREPGVGSQAPVQKPALPNQAARGEYSPDNMLRYYQQAFR